MSDPPPNRITLGIDPGLERTGYGVIAGVGREVKIRQAGVVRSRRTDPLASRVREIYEGVCEVIAQFRPEAVAVEELYSHYAHPKTAIQMGHARGVIFLAAAQAGVPVTGYTATQIKKVLTGSGRADKAQMQAAIRTEFGLAQAPEPADVADALAVALCHHHTGRARALGGL